MLDWPELVRIALIVSACVSGVIYLNNKFSTQTKQFYNEMERLKEAIITKLEYHEHHDDTRFSQAFNDIWALRLQIAQTGLRDKTGAQETNK